MASGWRRSMGIIKSFVGNAMGGLTGPSNVASWMIAGTVAYFLWVKPLKREQHEAALIYGNRNRVSKPEE